MPPPRKAHPPQTTKKARREYLKSNKLYQLTSPQLRAAERREELEKRAEKCRAKEERKKDNKRKREEKEEIAREAKRRALVEGKVPAETFLGKVRASQRRLNVFFVGPQKAQGETQAGGEEPSNEGDTHENRTMSQSIQSLAHGTSPAREEASESILPRTHSIHENVDQQIPLCHEQTNTSDMIPASITNRPVVPAAQETPQSSEQAQLDAQLSGNSDFDIAVDEDALQLLNELDMLEKTEQASRDMLPPTLTSPLKRKADSPHSPFASPAKSVRSALAEMSPSKVNIRAQEKPDVTSAPPSSSLTPSPAKQQLSESASDIIDGIATQDLQDDEYATDKENQDPLQDLNSQQTEAHKGRNTSEEKISKKELDYSLVGLDSVALLEAPSEQDEYGLDDDDFHFRLRDEQDEYDLDLDDESIAALAAPSQKTKRALSFTKLPGTKVDVVVATKEPQGSISFKPLNSLTKDEDFDLKPKKMLPPSLVVASKKRRPDTPRPPTQDVPAQDPPATQGNSFSFDGVDEEDLLNLVVDGNQTSKNSRKIPWNDSAQVTLSQGTAEALTPDNEHADD